MEEPTASAWIAPSRTKEQITYKLQINNIKHGFKRQVNDAIKGWNPSGSGWNPNNKTEILILERSFKDYYAFKKWSNEFPFELVVERDQRGRKKKSVS